MPLNERRAFQLLRLPWLLPLLLLVLLLATPVLAMQQAPTAAQEAAQSGGQPQAQDAEELPPEADVRARFDFTFDKITDKFAELLAASPLLLAAILIVAFAAWFGGFVSRRLHWLRLRTRNPYMNGLLRNVVRVLIILFGLVIALDLLNATTLVSAVLGSAGVVGLVLGFAFKDIAENYVAGILLSLRQPFSPGDHVRIDDNEGKVVALHSRSTMLMTLDGNELRLPNALVFKAIILNFSRNPRRRFDFNITIDASQSIRQAQSVGLAEIGKIQGVLDDPGPSWNVAEYTPAGVVLRFHGWIDQRDSDLGKVRSEAIRLVKAAFYHAGIEGPRTTYYVVNERLSAAAAPSAPAPEPAHSADADTSVNRDIDEQLAQAQQATDEGTNLLDTPQDKT